MKFTTFPENINPFVICDKNPHRIKGSIVKFGVDPTGPELHLGHLLPLRIVKRLKENGANIHIILGTFTAQIGDATGRDTTRPILSENETSANAKKILEQIERILGNDITIHRNTDWFNNMTLPTLMGIISKFSIQKLLNRENFSKRMDSNIPIAMHELMGPILQGIDSAKLLTNFEVGGTDQLFNFVISREVQEMLGQTPETCILSPVINGLDGRKMSKSFSNCIFINDTPTDVFGKVMSISDETMREWLPIFIGPWIEIDITKHPMVQKKELALQITTEIWSAELANAALANFENTIQHKELPENMPEFPIDNIVDIVKCVINGSKSEARRLLTSNAVRINGEKVSESAEVKSGDIIKVGKLKFAKII